MEQIGVVVETFGHMARVRARRHTACSQCGKCDGGLHSMGSPRELTIMAKNPLGAREGEVVEVKLGAQGVLLAAFLVYIIPLLGFFLGYILGRWLAGMYALAQVEAVGIGTGFLLLAASYFFLRSQEGRFVHSQRFTPVITAVLEEKQ